MQYWSEILYPQFLKTLSSDTYANMAELLVVDDLNLIAQRAIATFKYPNIDLSYDYNDELDNEIPKGFYFLQEITFKEINVILAWMKVYWMEYYTSQESIFQKQYTDKEIREFSNSSLINGLEKSYNSKLLIAKKIEENYYKVKDNTPTIGEIND